jgi:hypothetical protein
MPVPVAIPGINSPYDDFNSADASRWYRGGFIFSTNRGTQGKNFDLYATTLRWGFPQYTPDQPTPVRADEPTPFASDMMSDADERGPLILPDVGYRARLVFASDRAGGAGGLDLYVAEHDWSGDPDYGRLIALRPLTGLNTPADEAYLTQPIDEHQMLFASNRQNRLLASTEVRAGRPSGGEPVAVTGGDPFAFTGVATNDIYVATWDPRDSIEAVPKDIRRVDELSSPADDTAPFVYKNAHGESEVIFVSTRAGSLGEHDLYCARYVDPRPQDVRDQPQELQGVWPSHAWTTPVQLTALSSPRDEYRPYVLTINKTQFLIFSSTREGGQGGYDLYIVGYAGCPPTRDAARF